MSESDLSKLIGQIRRIRRGGSVTGLTKHEAEDLKEAVEMHYRENRSEDPPDLRVRPQFGTINEDEEEGWKVTRA